MNKKNYIELIYRKLLAKINKEEATNLKAWIDDSKENEHTFSTINNILDWTEDYKNEYQVDVELGLLKLQARIDEHKKREQIQRFRARRRRWSMAAAIALIFSLVAVWQIYFNTTYHTEKTTVATKIFTLDDGSLVHLNKNSSIQFAEDYSDCHRHIQLEGEAFFEVAPSSDCPFVVSTPATTITVLGTTFNVKAYPNTKQTEVSVKTGKVEVMSNKSEQKLVLQPTGKAIHIHGQTLQQSKDKDYQAMAWHTLDFRNVAIQDIAKAMETKYQVSLDLSDSNISHCTYTVDLNTLSLDAILSGWEMAFNVAIEKASKEQYKVKGGNKNCSNF